MSRITKASLIIAVFFGLDKVFGLVRQVLFARLFTTNELDIFLTSNNIPDLLSALISGGALGIALIPVLSEYLECEGRQAAWALFTRIVNLAFIVTAVLAVGIIALSDVLVRTVTAPGFEPAKQALTAELMRLDMIAILIFSISGLVMAGLQANQHFLLPAMAPGLYNLGQIVGVSILAPSVGLRLGPLQLPGFGLGLHGLVYGVIFGAALHLAIQIPGLIHFQYRWAPKIDFNHPGVPKVLALMGPRVLSMGMLQIYFVTRDNLASHLKSGAVTALNYGWFIQQVPETLIGTAIAIALLPSLAEFFTRGDRPGFRDTVNRALRVMLGLTLPAAVLLAIAVPPLVSGLFNFAPEDTTLVVWATRLLLLGLIGDTWLEVGVRSFYAQQNARLPLMAAALQAGAYLALAIPLARSLGVAGLALAHTLSFTGEALLLIFLLNRRFPGVLNVTSTLLRAGLAAVAGAAVVFLLMRLPLPSLPLAVASLAAGGLAVLPFVWPELRLLIKL